MVSPHLIEMEPMGPVPGSQPVENMYDVVNAMSWLASHKTSLQVRYKQMKEIPEMLWDLDKRIK